MLLQERPVKKSFEQDDRLETQEHFSNACFETMLCFSFVIWPMFGQDTAKRLYLTTLNV